MRHLEEGEIHAWLDGALDAEEARRVEAHAASCVDCAAAVAEARGLIAGASRVLLALDSVPGGVIPKREGAPPAPTHELVERVAADGRRKSPWWWMTTRTARIAAGLVLFVGAGAVALRETAMDRAPESMSAVVSVTSDSVAAPRQAGPVATDASASASTLGGLARSAREEDAERAGADRAPGPIPAAAPPASPAGAALARGRLSDINEQLRRATDRAGVGAAAAIPPAERTPPAPAPRPAPIAQLQGKVAVAPPIVRDSIDASSRRRADSIVGARDSVSSIQLRQPARSRDAFYAAPGATDATLGTIVGQVLDQEGQPLPSANVSLARLAIGAQSDDSGRFVLGKVPPGTYTIQVRQIGYEVLAVDDVVVTAGDTVEIPVAMPASTIRLGNVVVTDAPTRLEMQRSFAAAVMPADCYVLTFDSPANLRTTGQREQREARIRLEPPPGAAPAANARGGVTGGGVGGAARAAQSAATPPPPVADGRVVMTATWERIADDSILVRWFDGTQSLAMRAELQRESLRGQVVAGAEVDPARTSGVRGRRVACGAE